MAATAAQQSDRPEAGGPSWVLLVVYLLFLLALLIAFIVIGAYAATAPVPTPS